MKKALSAFLLISLFLISCTPELDVTGFTPGSGTEDSSDLSTIIFSAKAGTATISLYANKSWSLEVHGSEDYTWLSIGPSSGGKGSSSINIKVKENDSHSERSATLVLTCDNISKEIKVIQHDAKDIIPLKESYEVYYDATKFELPVMANTDYKVSTTADWLRYVETKALRSDTIIFEVDSNDSKTSRNCSVIITDGTVTRTIGITQLPTTHFPITANELKKSTTISRRIGNMVDSLFSIHDGNLDNIVSSLKEDKDIFNAKANPTYTGISIMQRDSLWLNFLFNYTTRAEHDDDSSLYSITNNSIASYSNDYRVNSKNKALILAPFQDSFNAPLSSITRSLYNSGFDLNNIIIKQNQNADITQFIGDKLTEYSLIIFDTHGSLGYHAREPEGEMVYWQTLLVSATEYNEKIVQDLIDKRILTWDDIAVVGINNSFYLSMTTNFIDKTWLDAPCVIMTACNSSHIKENLNGQASMIQSFLISNASIISGYYSTISGTITNIVTQKIIEYMSHGYSFQDAEKLIINSDVLETLKNERIFNLQNRTDISESERNASIAACDQHLFESRPKTSPPYFLVDPHPKTQVPDIQGRNIILSWESNLSDFQDVWSYYDYHALKKVSNTLHHQVKYEVYINDNKLPNSHFLDRDPSNKQVSFYPGDKTDFTWYVIANYYIDGQLSASYKSEVEEFTYTAPYIDAKLLNEDISCEAGTVTVEVDSNVDVSVDVPNNDWLTYKGVSSNGKKYTFSLTNNTGIYSRSVNVKFYNRELNLSTSVRITQNPAIYPDDWTTREFWHRAFVLLYARQGCSPAPPEMEGVNTFKSRFNDKVEVLSVYCDDGYPLSQVFNSPSLVKKYDFSYTPCPLFNGKDYVRFQYTSADWQRDMIKKVDANKARTGIGFTSRIEGSTINVDVSLLVKSKGNYSISVFLMEDNVIAFQLGARDEDNYKHDHVARKALTADTGDKFSTTQNNVVKNFSYSTTIPSSVNKNNLKVLVVTHIETGKYSVSYSNSRNETFYGSYVDNAASEKAGVRHKVDFIDNRDGNNENIIPGGDIDFN